MSMVQDKIEALTDQLIADREAAVEAKAEWIEAKDVLSRKRKIWEEANEKVGNTIDEINDLKNGQPHLPFKSHPDVETGGTPALLAVAGAMAQDKLKNEKSLNTNLSVLIGYGATESMVNAVMDSDLGISTVRQLCDSMEKDSNWFKKVPGLGAKKKSKLEEALQKFLDDGVNKESRKSEAPDNRLKKCGNAACGQFRGQDVERCPACNETTFELENPPSDTDGESTLPGDYVVTHEVPLEVSDVTVGIHAVQDPDTGLWHSSYSIHQGCENGYAGRKIPHHSSAAYESEDMAIEAACVDAANKLMELELDSAAASVRQFSQERSTSTSSVLSADDDEEDHGSHSEDSGIDLDAPVAV